VIHPKTVWNMWCHQTLGTLISGFTLLLFSFTHHTVMARILLFGIGENELNKVDPIKSLKTDRGRALLWPATSRVVGEDNTLNHHLRQQLYSEFCEGILFPFPCYLFQSSSSSFISFHWFHRVQM
jgi:hypothetical protein